MGDDYLDDLLKEMRQEAIDEEAASNLARGIGSEIAV